MNLHIFTLLFLDESIQPRLCNQAYSNAPNRVYSTNKDIETPTSYYNMGSNISDDYPSPSRCESSGSSVDQGSYFGNEGKRIDRSEIQFENSRSTISSRDQSSSKSNFQVQSLGFNGHKQSFNTRPPFCDDREQAKRNKIEQPTTKKLNSVCQVCGDQAPEHIHYGSVSCFSCRAFFRRSVSKSHMYVCPGNKQCSIVVTTRKNCQYCRYQACLKAGMRPTWVLTDKEKNERIKNKKPSKGFEEGNSYAGVRNERFGQNCDNGVSVNTAYFTTEDNRYIEELLIIQSKAAFNEACGKQVARALAKCIQADGADVESLKLPRWATLEVLRVQYSRFSQFARLMDDFAGLSRNTQEILLRNNLEAISIIRLAYIFKPRNDTPNSTCDVVPFLSQLSEMGFDGKMCQEIGVNVTKEPSSSLTLNQIFPTEWLINFDHFTLHHKVFDVLNRLITMDPKLVLLYQIVNLFNTSNIGSELESTDRESIVAIQERWTSRLQGYAGTKMGNFKASMMLPKIILLMFELRLLSEKNCFDRE